MVNILKIKDKEFSFDKWLKKEGSKLGAGSYEDSEDGTLPYKLIKSLMMLTNYES